MLAGKVVAGAFPSWPGLTRPFAHAAPVLTVFVALTYLLSTALHYASSCEVESRAAPKCWPAKLN